jgi:two-component system cell cycle sensor histidine kinase/response regulator CckA
MHNANDRVNKAVAVGRDGAEPKSTEEAQPAERAHFHAVFQAAADGIVITDERECFVEANPAACAMFGVERGDLLGRDLYNVSPPELHTYIGGLSERFLEEGFQSGELDLQRPDGSRLPVEFRRTANFLPGRHLSVMRDISERRRSEEALLRSQRLFAESQRLARIGSWEWEVGGDEVEGSDEFYRLYGVDRGKLTFEGMIGLVHADDREGTRKTIEAALDRREPYQLEARIVRPDGEVRVVLEHGEVILGDDGEPALVRGTAQDITERWGAEQARRQSAERYRQIVETTTEGVWMIDEHNVTTFVNGRMADMLGHERDGMVGQSLFEPMDEPRRREALDHIARRRRGIAEKREFTFVREDATQLQALLSTNPLFDDEGHYKGSLAMVSDMTERVRADKDRTRLEAQLDEVQRLETVGQLAGGIAHDFNNLLAVISSYAEFVDAALPANSEVRDDLSEIRRAAERAASLTRQLLVFSRRDAVTPVTVSLNTVATEMDKLLQRTLDEDIELRLDLAPDLWPVKADVSQIEQVLVNLAVNARDAMPGGGRLTIQTLNIDLDESYVEAHVGTTTGRHVRLSVTDTGTGMPSGVAERAFEPFFTTKSKDKGTGLGLATTYGIVKQSAGHIQIYSEVGHGTSIKVLLPACADELPQVDAQEAPSRPQTAGETVLVVEDEPAVRALTCRILSERGYRVVGAEDPMKALELCRDSATPIDLLLTDVVMPHLLGPQLAEEVTRLRPAVRVLYMSGYTDRSEGLNGEIVDKPFSAKALLDKVRDVLDSDAIHSR